MNNVNNNLVLNQPVVIFFISNANNNTYNLIKELVPNLEFNLMGNILYVYEIPQIWSINSLLILLQQIFRDFATITIHQE